MSDKLIGKTLAGRFVLETVLGTGATGSVYRAQQTSVDRVVAVKTLHPFLQQREDFKARFEIEAKAIARLNHPNCITLYDFGYDDEFDVFYMAVEYIKGDSLADLMANHIPCDDVLSISYQVADALEHAHREGILHRDLKPENIMIQMMDSGRYAVKVLDFGLARLYEAAVDDDSNEPPSGRYKQITEAGQVYGTPAYMSPEQCRGKSELSPATDIYALGTMMFELLEGRLPFFSKSTAELIMMQMTENPPKMERLDVPVEVRDLIHCMMAKDPSTRPQSAREVLVPLLSYVRLDASQEFRILPNTTGEMDKLTPEQVRVLTQGTSSGPRTTEDRPRVATLELSNDEMNAARGPGRVGLLVALLVAVLAVAGATMLVAPEPEQAVAAPAAVDAMPATVAESTREAEGVEPEQPVEVAKNGETAEPQEKPRKRLRPRKRAPATSIQADPASKPKPSPTPDEADRPKTLKLTY